MNKLFLRHCGALCLALILLSGCAGSPSAADTGTPSPETSSPENTSAPSATSEETPGLNLPEGAVATAVHLDETFQTMDGFGAGFTWYSDWMLANPEKKEEIADLLFKDAKLSILRFKNEMGYHGDAIPPNCREAQIYELAATRAAEYGEVPTVLMSCWSPPAYLKSNNKINGGGTLKKRDDGTYMYDEYAQWWADSVETYRNAGVPIDYLSIQNECDFKVSYDGMEMGQSETDSEASYAKAFLGVYDALQDRFGESAPKMLGPETMTFSRSALAGYLKEILDTKPESLAGVAFHLYAGGSSKDVDGGSTNQPSSFNINFMDNYDYFGADYPLWQTEFYRGTPMQTAMLISNSLIYGNLNAYIYWGGIWTSDAYTHDMISVQTSGSYGYASTYWVMRHYSEFIRPGYVRVKMDFPFSANFRCSAFASPEGDKLALVFVNQGEEAYDVAIPIAGYQISDSAIYQTILADDDYGTGEYYLELGALGAGSTLSLPANSITTIDISGSRS